MAAKHPLDATNKNLPSPPLSLIPSPVATILSKNQKNIWNPSKIPLPLHRQNRTTSSNDKTNIKIYTFKK
jgi:hypothetical protein